MHTRSCGTLRSQERNSMRTIYLSSDHAGLSLKNTLVEFLRGRGEVVNDLGPDVYAEGDDYPDYCIPLAEKVAQNKGSFGIVVGLSGQGEAMACNRVRGARAAVFYGSQDDILTLSRQHNDANILSLGAKFLPPSEASRAVELWLGTLFSGEERHVRRIEKLDHD